MNELKIAIIGYGVVGKATNRQLDRTKNLITTMIHDPDEGYKAVYKDADVVLICTPTEHVEEYLNTLKNHKNVFIRSTIPFTLVKDTNFAVWPEFLTERTAYQDSINPKANIIGGTPEQFNILNDITTIQSFKYTTNIYAALMKLATNLYFMQKVSFANILYNLCKDNDLEYQKLKDALSADDRMWIHDHFDVPGPDGKLGYGGKCFPTNMEIALDLVSGTDKDILEKIKGFNEEQRFNWEFKQDVKDGEWITGYNKWKIQQMKK
jgi:UDPglucose 6-dehydrogenase